MKHNLISLAAVVLIMVSTAGCSVVRLMETAAGVGVEETVIDTETRQSNLSRKDVRLRFDATGNKLSFRLQYQPYYRVEQRQLVKKRTTELSTLDLLLGIAELGVWSGAILTLPTWDGGILAEEDATIDDVDWNAAEDWKKAVIIGAPLDLLLFALVQNMSWTGPTSWKQLSESSRDPEWIADHRYRIDLPDYNFGKDYRTQTGDEKIDLSGFLPGVFDPSLLRNVQSVNVRASTKVGRKNYEKTITISDQAEL